MNRFQAAYRAWRNPNLLLPTKNYSSSYALGDLWGRSGTIDSQLATTTFGATLAYYKVPAIKSSVDVIAENAASIVLVETDAQGNEIARSDENPDDSAMITTILDAYNCHGVPLIQEWVSSRLLYGMTFIQLVKNPFHFIKSLRWLNPNAMQIDAPRGIIEGYRYYGNSEYMPLMPQEVLYGRAFNPGDDIYGYSDTLNAMQKANITLDFDRMVIAYYRNGAQPGIIINFKEKVTLEEAKKVTENFREQFRGVDNFFKTRVTNIPSEITTLDAIDISKPLQVSKDAERSIYLAYRVPPELLGDTQNNPYQFSDEKKNAFMQTVVKPHTDAIQMALNYKAMKFFAPPGHNIHFDYSQFDSVSETERQLRDMAEANYRSGGITFNEYRKALNEQPITGGNFFLIPNTGYTAVPVEQIAQVPQLLQASAQPALPATVNDLNSAVDRLSRQSAKALTAGLPVQTITEPVKKYDPNQTRDESGQFGSGGGGSSSSGDKPSSDGGSDKPKPKKPKKPKPEKPKRGKPDWNKKPNRVGGKDSDGYQDYGHVIRNPKNGDSNTQIRAMSDSHVANLDKKQQNAVSTYTGDSFRDINGGLRGDGKLSAAHQRTVDNLDSALAKNSLSENTILYRGMRPSPELTERLVPGATFTDSAYTSATFDQSMGDSFSSGVLMRIKAPAGTNGMSVASISNFPPESEFLLPRDTSYRITGVYQDRGQMYVDAEIVTDANRMKAIVALLMKGRKQAANPPEQDDDRSDKFNWNADDIVFDEPIETEDDEADSEDETPSKAIDNARSAFAYIPLRNNEDVLRIQRQLKEQMTDSRIKWQIPSTFHVTLCMGNLTDIAITQLAELKISEMELKPALANPIAYFDTPDGKALHIALDVSTATREVQEIVYQQIWKVGDVTNDDHFESEQWKPHITLAYIPNEIAIPDFSAQDTFPSFVIHADTIEFARDDYDPVLVLTAPKHIRSFWNTDDPQSDDLRKWQTVAVKRYKSGNVDDALSFESAVLPAILQSSIKGALQAVSTPDQIYTIFDDAVRYLAHA